MRDTLSMEAILVSIQALRRTMSRRKHRFAKEVKRLTREKTPDEHIIGGLATIASHGANARLVIQAKVPGEKHLGQLGIKR
jgi:hypothetical protein